MGYVLLVPEMVILWVAHQYFGSKEITEKYKDQGWTKTHGFFLLMGGFQLQENGISVRALTVKEFDELYSAGRIDWPRISKEDIEDKSKADAFTKGIVLMQTGWFVLQCITRGAYKLAVTELEVVTLAFAALTTVIYAFWWHKPLDVGRPVPIGLKSPQTDAEKLDSARTSINSAEDVVQGLQTPCSPTTSDLVPPISDPPFQTQQNSHPIHPSPGAPPQFDSATPGMLSTEDAARSCNLLPPPSDVPPPEQLDFHSMPEPVTAVLLYNLEAGRPKEEAPTSTPARKTRFERFSGHLRHFRAFFRHQRHKRGLFVALFYALVYHPLRFFLKPFEDMVDCAELKSDNPHRVPTFYAPTVVVDDNDGLSYATAIMVTFVFGGIHCIAWRFHFPTLVEQWFWRAGALSVCGLPLIFGFLVMMLPDEGETNAIEDPVTFLLTVTTLAYFLARISLLILPLLALRSLPPSAFVDINWTTIFPHV
ncbi:hypothetical protein NLJ89_g8593 [Agrocybe chaxingu]|uniref:Uncharacterized protein n=1 Tax=Agrocybe chaxingu TaxID=84603 RepID=A0A9W8JUC6_9AGAR|nr:hypothetical protein NLJ89_g8593 [Agrocybe chaxingu]